MAKGDDSRARNQIDYQGNLAQNNLNNLRNDTLVPQNQAMWNNFLTAQQQNQGDYANITGRFNQFADTGGYSPGDISNIRARAVSPIRGLYAGANRDVDRQRALQGGYSPGYGVLKARLARQGSDALSDATTNAEGMIAQLKAQGKQFGTSGLLSAYGTTPAQTAMTGNQAIASTQQRIQGEDLQSRLGLGIMGAQNQAAQLPGKYQSALGNIGGTLGLIGQAGGMIYPWLGGGGMQQMMGGSGNYGRNPYADPSIMT